MAKIVHTNTLTSEKVNISDAYELFSGSRITLCAEKTCNIYRDISHRHIITFLTSLTDGCMEDITSIVLTWLSLDIRYLFLVSVLRRAYLPWAGLHSREASWAL